MLDAFRSAGLDEADTLRYYSMYSSYVLSFCAVQAGYEVSHGRERSEESLSWVADYSAIDADRYPAVSSLRDQLGGLLDRDVYRHGIEIILESAAARAAAAR
jgi:hypothetical protein